MLLYLQQFTLLLYIVLLRYVICNLHLTYSRPTYYVLNCKAVSIFKCLPVLSPKTALSLRGQSETFSRKKTVLLFCEKSEKNWKKSVLAAIAEKRHTSFLRRRCFLNYFEVQGKKLESQSEEVLKKKDRPDLFWETNSILFIFRRFFGWVCCMFLLPLDTFLFT